MPDITPPRFQADRFHCPNCNTFSRQNWYVPRMDMGTPGYEQESRARLVYCDACSDFSMWKDREMVCPDTVAVPEPNADMSQELQDDYKEAASILRKSPRGAAALLRLVIQKLCHEVGCKQSETVNLNIKELVARGLAKKVQQSLDIVRVTGGEAVHPGVLDLRDDENTAMQLFSLVNLIARQMISEEKEVESIYLSLPEEKRAAIERRDAPVQPPSPAQKGEADTVA